MPRAGAGSGDPTSGVTDRGAEVGRELVPEVVGRAGLEAAVLDDVGQGGGGGGVAVVDAASEALLRGGGVEGEGTAGEEEQKA